MTLNGQPPADVELRPFEELRDTGLLWLINKVLFHPRGYAIAIAIAIDGTGHALGWSLEGDGSEPWRFEDDEQGFRAAEATLAQHRAT